MNKKVLIVVLFSILILAVFCKIISAQDLTELQDKKNELQNQIDESNEQINQIEIELTENLEQLNNINGKIYQYEDEIASLEAEIAEIEIQIEKVTEKLNLIQENYDAQRDILKNRLVATYEAGDIVYLDVLLSSSTFSEFIGNYYLIGEIVKYDNELLESIENQKSKIENIKVTLEQNKQTVKEVRENKEKTRISLENSRIIQNSYINKLTEEEKAIQSKIQEYEKELNDIENRLIILTMGSVGESYVGGEFAWPAPGYTTITSYYGMRLHPVLKVYRTHNGTDIAMPTGSYIIAANDGVVTSATYSTNGYGNMVIIDHGGGVTTLYAHGSEIIAQTGQTVKRGDIIMKAGSTGWSTGPHLHFEIRINGKSIDALPYITTQKSNNPVEENTDITQDNGG